jgi:ComF family protein
MVPVNRAASTDIAPRRCSFRRSVRDWLAALLPEAVSTGAAAADQARWRADDDHPYCARCGVTLPEKWKAPQRCPACQHRRRLPWQRVIRLGPYAKPLDTWIIACKFQKHWAWAQWFGEQLARGVETDRPTVVVPVPLHWRRRLTRGFDQSALMAAALARTANLPLAHLLRRSRPTAPQSHLMHPAQRWRNVERAFSMQPVDLAGWDVVLVDDVKTTGSTAARCAALLRDARADQITLAVAAVADPPNGSPTRSADDPAQAGTT